MSAQLKAVLIGAAVLAAAAFAFLALGGGEDVPVLGGVLRPKTCPLSGVEPADEALLERPAVGVKVENNPVAYPLAGLEKAEVVYEELVEGGLTRFLALYHCTDAKKVGPVRSARTVDPAIMTPTTRILAAAGGNAIVRKALRKGDIVLIDEPKAGNAMRRVESGDVSFEHTLFGDTEALRRTGRKRYDQPPKPVLRFGRLRGPSKPARRVTIRFSGAAEVQYRWKGGRWARWEDGERFMTATGRQLRVDNVLVEEHRVRLSKGVVDVAGNPSIEIADVTGSGRAVLFRDGRAVVGRWTRRSRKAPVVFRRRSRERMVLRPGTTWIELVPDDGGEVKGSFSYVGGRGRKGRGGA